LLVVVAIIAVLIGILLPALGSARDAGRAAVCLGNLRQMGLAWTMYLGDFDNFPVRDEWTTDLRQGLAKVRFGWGGVHWYGYDSNGNPIIPDDNESTQLLSAYRPVNPYLGLDVTTPAFARAFRCPSDTGLVYIGHPEWEIPWAEWGAGNPSGEGDYTVFGQTGTSYEANKVMYTRFVDHHQELAPNRGPRNVVVEPSRFVLVGDSGVMTVAWHRRLSETLVYGPWHGSARGQMAFLDGSARLETVLDNPNGYQLDFEP
jgi:type II secretory pathway pseudopilin PulG